MAWIECSSGVAIDGCLDYSECQRLADRYHIYTVCDLCAVGQDNEVTCHNTHIISVNMLVTRYSKLAMHTTYLRYYIYFISLIISSLIFQPLSYYF